METVTDFIFGGSKITADGDCSSEIKIHLLFGRKAIRNLGSILKSRDITLPTNVPSSQSYGFFSSHVWMWELDIKKAEHQRIGAFGLWCWRRLLRVPWTAKRSNQSVLKEISPECSLEGLMLKLKLQYFGHMKWRPDSLEKAMKPGKIQDRRIKVRQDEVVGWPHWLNRHEFEQALGDGEGQRWLVCCSSWGCKELDTTEWLNNNNKFRVTG